jgi:alginate O-acetyltransferase complex protein AlgI
MLFNSLTYAVFLPLVFIIYWKVLNRNLKAQNFFMIIAGYVFYGWWDWRFLSLLIFSTFFDYILGLKIFQAQTIAKRKAYLIGSILINLGLLGTFKYFNFFVDSFVTLFQHIGITLEKRSLNVILPVGISFYTFQSMSYTIDLYRKKIEPTRDLIAYSAFVSFFPQLLAGPIERAANMLPQFVKKRTFDYEFAKDGLRQILWGLFKKIVVADTCATQVNYIFGNYHQLSGFTLFIGAIFFAFQIYGDFSGYSDIAIGSAKLFGFKLMRNFAFPYFSRNIAEFWRRWHISLSTWFRDYLYIPLGGNRGSKWQQIRNGLITFTVSGFWHGANWTFVIWGFLNGLYYVPGILFGNIKKKKAENKEIIAHNRRFPTVPEIGGVLLTFGLTLIAWVFFRSPDIHSAFAYLGRMVTFTFNRQEFMLYNNLLLVLILLIIEWNTRENEHPLKIDRFPLILRWATYYTMSALIFLYFREEVTFIYFQF